MTIPPMTVQPPPPKPRRLRLVPVLITSLIVLICLVVAADRIGERIAEDQVGAQLQEKLRTPEQPRVEVGRIPFLTQVIAQRYGEVRIEAEQIPVQTTSATAGLDRLDLDLRDVTLQDQQLAAATAEGNAFLDYESLSTLGGAEVTYLDQGRITIDFTAPVGGQTVSGTLTGKPVLEEGQLSLIEPQLRLAGIDLPKTLVDALLAALLRSFTLPDLPFDLTLTSVTASDAGLTFELSGRDLAINR